MADSFANLNVDDLAEGENIRFALTEIADLAADIKRRGVLQPIIVIPTESGDKAEVLIGHRRLAAAKLAGLKTIPAILRTREIEVKRLLDQVAENSQRVQLTPIEEAAVCQALTEKGFTPAQIGAQMRKSDTWVTTRLRLLALPQCLQDAIHAGKVTVTRALDLPKDHFRTPEQVKNLARHLNDGGLDTWWREYYQQREPQRAPTFERFERPTPPTRPPGAKFSLTIHFDAEDCKILDALVKASTVFTKRAEVVTGMLGIEMESVRDQMHLDGWERESLRYMNGMTDDEKRAYDAAQDGPASGAPSFGTS